MGKSQQDHNVVVLGFDDMSGAENMLENVSMWEEKGYFSVKDAVIVTRGSGSNNIEIKQTVKKTGKWALGGGGIGFLAGLLLGGPVGGLIVGATVGAISGALKDSGIDDDSIRKISASMPAESSTLFLMTVPTEGRDDEAFYAELKPFKAKVVSTSLSGEAATKLNELFKDEE